jgi:hypothetical protein
VIFEKYKSAVYDYPLKAQTGHAAVTAGHYYSLYTSMEVLSSRKQNMKKKFALRFWQNFQSS